MWKDYKYLFAYLLPLAGFLGVHLGGAWSPGSIYVAFVLLPLLELVLPASTDNHPEVEEDSRSGRRLFDWLLYLNLPVLYGTVGYFLYVATTRDLSGWETAGMVCNVGLLVGSIGINVAHELGHRSTKGEQRLAQALLLPGLYMHFFIEHNRGHHRHVATPLDPATSRRDQTVYAFWLRSVTLSYVDAWRLDKPLMFKFQLIQLAYLAAITLVFGWPGCWLAIGAAVFGFLMLETVNYIEHYGLLRRQNAQGRYEAVLPQHSWNSDHELGRILLYELTRHSDHHFKSTRKYQILRRFDESPQLPSGYPACMLMALLPPVWFRVMNPRVDHYTAYSNRSA
ncbi:Alkane 1-monooxygenase 2 [Neolewinella maritima]|uniref:Alkane 1-monooxygenase 2 n=1 Tax=Neolewinella maritima TaxID=1383882 RepID=A0ABM9AX93_9BACT|nr:alkane 1-monooxygenase [Neolewinella maritima]CAH0998802.1 Alkane 1-monooxygenase 2 [Neolewinella maritima]